ncbi:MAG: tRNA-intron lyase [Candidatus Diapherotrites archaeon]|nr:tRNA-intron lyase [Candidatus Diapherotrites archaeon]
MVSKKRHIGIELVGNKVLVFARAETDRLHQKGFGERKEGHLVLDLFEALYLLDKKRISIIAKGKKLSSSALRALGQQSEDRFFKKFVVFSDLRERGFVVKTGFKFGFDFRVYPRGKKPGEAHTEFVVEVKGQGEKLSMPHLSRMVRMSQTLHTQCLVAVVDSENEINYYSMSRLVL